MIKNPLFPESDESPDAGDQQSGNAYALHNRKNVIQPLTDDEKVSIGANPAADLIREKLSRLYASEPDALAEEKEAEVIKPRSKHQEFMYQLSTSGKSLAEIQTEWHNYYVGLPDNEKHDVWQEFYENNSPSRQAERPVVHQPEANKAKEVVVAHAQKAQENRVVVADHTPPKPEKPVETRKPSAIREAIRSQVAARTAALSDNAKQNIKSLAFGITTGVIVLFIFLFGFFNEIMIAPFIQPGRTSATPIIVSSDSVDASQPSIIIPKINVQIPVIYNVASNSEADIQSGLNDGVVHYPTTKKPGEKGNAAFFGHSSNNIFNKGHYKFAFVLLHKLQNGDTFYLTYNNTVYGYKVISTKIVDPSEVSVLNDIPGEEATATLITCDPPGTTLHRLVVVGRQVSPDPAGNTAAQPSEQGSDSSNQLPGNGPSAWTRLWRSVF